MADALLIPYREFRKSDLNPPLAGNASPATSVSHNLGLAQSILVETLSFPEILVTLHVQDEQNGLGNPRGYNCLSAGPEVGNMMGRLRSTTENAKQAEVI